MLVLLEYVSIIYSTAETDGLFRLKSFQKDKTTRPDPKQVLPRIALICQDMRKDIRDCYGGTLVTSINYRLITLYFEVLDAQESSHLAIQFLKASSWNKKLAVYAATFETRRNELVLALGIQTAVTVEGIKEK